MEITKITLDAGHGPDNIWPRRLDPGAVAGGLQEYRVVWELADVGRKFLLEHYRCQVLMTRPALSSPKHITQRQPESERWGADYYLSLHLNASANPQANGLETFWADTKDIAFARLVQDSAVAAFGLAQRTGRREDMPGLKYQSESPRGRLVVLDGNNAQAALLEAGFVSNRQDMARVTNLERQLDFWRRLAEGLKLPRKAQAQNPTQENITRVTASSRRWYPANILQSHDGQAVRAPHGVLVTYRGERVWVRPATAREQEIAGGGSPQ